MRVGIVDCYSDEPAGLGVPPYLGTTPRYVFGAAKLARSEPIYLNIDDVRAGWGERHDAINLTTLPGEANRILRRSDLVVILGGSHTPGKYLRGRIGVPREIRRIVEGSSAMVLVGGPVAEGTMGGGRSLRSDMEALGNPDQIIDGDPEAFVYKFLTTGAFPANSVKRSYAELHRFALAGAEVLRQMKVGPDLVCEVETSRGCARSIVGGCSFCSECSRYGLPVFREVMSIVDEVRRLELCGARNVRLGRQSCFFSYQARAVGEVEVPVPNPQAVEALLSACSSLGLNSLHIDNVNPAVLAKHPQESKKIIKSLVEHCTPGNVAALGIETADPAVVRRNNLKTMPEDSLEAIRLICTYGSDVGSNGQPSLLPGLNFVLGLPGETKDTYEMNKAFLQRVGGEGLLLRRINIRRVIPVRGTRLWGNRWSQRALSRWSRKFVGWVRANVDRPMLKRVYPVGLVLKDLVSEVKEGATTFCRFPGSYPVVVGVDGAIPAKTVLDGIVVDHGFRSLSALRFPVDINSCPASTLRSFPGIGPKRAARIIRSRPIGNRAHLEHVLGPDPPNKGSLDLICRATSLA